MGGAGEAPQGPTARRPGLLRPGVAVLLGAAAVVVALPLVRGHPAAAAPVPGISVVPSPTPAFAGDAPDPDIVQSGGTYYAFTTGTALGNNIQALVDTSGSPASGWAPYTWPLAYGSTALPVVPSWEQPGTQTSPGVYDFGGRWIMFYDAAQLGHAGDTGFNCLSSATAATLSPAAPVFTDTSTGPLLCDAGLGGAIDPSPFVDPASGQPYLVWKTNDGGSAQPAGIWSQTLGPDGRTPVGQPHLLLSQDTVGFPFETTIENPQMVESGGTYFLLFSTGVWDSSSYAEAAVGCAGPSGPCGQPTSGPFLTSYTTPDGTVAGPGGGSLFQDATGQWQLAYAAWTGGCTSYACGGGRSLYVAPATLQALSLAPPVTGIAPTPGGGGYWLTDASGAVSAHGTAVPYGSMAGQPLNAPIEHLVPTPDGRGYWLVAADGGTFAFGDAGFYGSTGGMHLDAPVVDLAPTPDGHGYWLVAADGGVFAFGDAAFFGSMGGHPLNAPVVGIAADPATGGYWMVATDGGIFAFGAPFWGSTGALRLNRPVNGMAPTPDGGGYWFVASDGGIFAFGDAGFHGSMGGQPLNAPVVGMAADRATGGYWLVGGDGGVFAFDAPFDGAD